MRQPRGTGGGVPARVAALPTASIVAAVQGATSWREVARRLDLRASRDLTAVRHRCDAEGVDTAHLPGPQADAAFAAQVRGAASWDALLEALGYAPGSGSARASVRGRARRLGLDLAGLEPAPPPADDLVVALGPPRPELLRTAGPAVVAAALLQRGCQVHWPLEPAPYDLLAVLPGTGCRALRVQVKTGTRRDGAAWVVGLTHGGPGKQGAYAREDVDAFGLVDGDGAVYLVPVEHVEGQVLLSTTRYQHYRLLLA